MVVAKELERKPFKMKDSLFLNIPADLAKACGVTTETKFAITLQSDKIVIRQVD